MSIKYAANVDVHSVAIHYVNLGGDAPILSTSTAALEPASVEYIKGHIVRALNSSDVTNARPYNEIGPVHIAAKEILAGNWELPGFGTTLVEQSAAIAEFTFKMAKEHPRCPDFDMVVARVTIEDTEAVAILCLDHLPAVKHMITDKDGDSLNTTLKAEYVLPTVKQKANKVGIFYMEGTTAKPMLWAMAVEIPFKDAAQDKVFFFLRNVMQCTAEWDDESLTAFLLAKSEAWAQVVARNDIRVAISLRNDLRQHFTEGGYTTPKEVLEMVYDDNEQIEKAIDMFEEGYGIKADTKIMINPDVVKKRIGKQQWKTDGGFTIVGSPDLFVDPNRFEVKHNEDGTANFIIKGIRNMSAKA